MGSIVGQRRELPSLWYPDIDRVRESGLQRRGSNDGDVRVNVSVVGAGAAADRPRKQELARGVQGVQMSIDGTVRGCDEDGGAP